MKSLIALGFSLSLIFGSTAFSADETPAQDPHVKIRWEEKTDKNEQRILTVFIKNDGFSDLKKGATQVVILGNLEAEREAIQLPVDAPKNRETKCEFTLKKRGGFLPPRTADGKLPDLPVTKIVSVTVVPSPESPKS